MPEQNDSDSFDHKTFLANLTRKPGIYQMQDADGKLLYVGKAKNLKNRVSSYFRGTGLNNKTVALVSRIRNIEVTVTRSETEALLLEQNLIKANRPPYNILLRDDKSYPYILITDQPYPQLTLHRGAKRRKGKYYGPYPSAGAVRDSLAFLQKTFKVRPCEDSVFKNRSRPCLQYQINRCSGPCVDLVSETDYAEAIHRTRLFLEGKNQQLTQELADAMEQASADLAFEKAAELRDQISSLNTVREKQYIEGESGDLDIIAGFMLSGIVCVQVMSVRGGRILGSKSYYPTVKLDESMAEILSAFVGQYYLGTGTHAVPKEILLNEMPENNELLAEALAEHAGRKVALLTRVRGARARWVGLAASTAEQNCRTTLANRQNTRDRFESLRDALGLEQAPERMECFDISHSSGERTVASCVVFDGEGPLKSDYRRFNIEGITPGDDYAAMGQALLRRYERLQKTDGKLPDLLVIDGGKGQLSQAREVLAELGVTGVNILGIAKGPTRKAGFERLFIGDDQTEAVLPPNSPAMHLLQQIRDEAHRFAITGHRGRRDKQRRESTLEQIDGVGPARRRELLRYFGGLPGIRRASVEDLANVNGISRKMAQTIYDALHNE